MIEASFRMGGRTHEPAAILLFDFNPAGGLGDALRAILEPAFRVGERATGIWSGQVT